MVKMRSLSILIISSLAASALACSCRPDLTAEDSYCRADFRILVYVKTNGHVQGMTRVYKVDLLVAYDLGSQNRDLLDKTHIYTATDSAACGVILQKGKYYVLSGYYERHGKRARFRIGLCDYQKMFDTNPQNTFQPPNCGGY